MGEGTRRPGDREDISSDEDDELEKQRRNWSRKPLQGASLLIAKLWLEKARKRRAFLKHVTGIIEGNKADRCAMTGRTEPPARLVCTLARHGRPDKHAIDTLIAGFEDTYGPQERDVNLWKAYFRSHAEFITLDQSVLDARERERINRLTERPGGAHRATRAEDVSSDESDEDVIFDPLVVTRSSPEGRMLSKWLTAARMRLGGEFPRPDARAAMERYAEKMRKRKLAGGKKKIAGVEKEEDKKKSEEEAQQQRFEKRVLRLSAASTALARRWLRAAQDSLTKRFSDKGKQLRDDLAKTLSNMPEEDEWYYGADLIHAGRVLVERGERLQNHRLTLEAQAAVRVRRIENDFNEYEREQRENISNEREVFENNLATHAERAKYDLQLRLQELERERDKRREQCEEEEKKAREEEGAASTELLEKHRQIMHEIEDEIRREALDADKSKAIHDEEQRIFFRKSQDLAEHAILDRRMSAVTNIREIRKELADTVHKDEATWQADTAKWLNTGKRKVELKRLEDAENEAAKRRKRKK
eukprot:CAMPEP_0197301142 /NCGR_PEP_ID=MMETSP0890-20130614/49982_1 /TAXON_ID=44058 ORGANISM="Aureoumbra lagunensis, Strain CCMP1510" /NCGR_SAMPLE_ID=MMETSP0890 /ASSEMBLY_ACC=CAM_ASM_000533 /LENGTH=531 /DNA_ID=CAMNT_0042780345 /DNA_START=635 /DNA_END=2230 /DNA_ORIENTATION=-